MNEEEELTRPFVYSWLFCNLAYLFDFGCVQEISRRWVMLCLTEGCRREYMVMLCDMQAAANRAYAAYMEQEGKLL